MKRVYMSWFCALLMLSSTFVVGMQVNENAEAIMIGQENILYTPHAPITINSDAEFPAIASSGDGSFGNPWIIEGWDINGTGNPYCIFVQNTVDYFIIIDNYLHHANGDGVYLDNVDNAVIDNNEIGYNLGGDGIYLNYVETCTVSNNYINDNWGAAMSVGIRSRYSNNITIIQNDIVNNEEELSIYESYGIQIYHNNIIKSSPLIYVNSASINWDCGYPGGGNYWSDYIGIDNFSGPGQNESNSDGIGDTPYIFSGDQDNYPLMSPWGSSPQYDTHLPIRINSNADFDEAHGIVNWDTGDGSPGNPWIIEGWDINGTGYDNCIYIGNTSNYFELRDCYLHDSQSFMSGLYLFNVMNGAIISNNVSYNAGDGICIEDGYNIMVLNNSMMSNSEGMSASDSDFIEISGNTIFGNTGWNTGIYGASLSNSIISNNNIGNNAGDGIGLELSNGNIISGNQIFNEAWEGFYIYESYENEITYNEFRDCEYGITNLVNIVGIYANNNIHHNNFINNTNQAYDDGYNTWDDGYPSGGNYWSDYIGPDFNSDGIGDMPYTDIDGGTDEFDEYPLMEPWQLVGGSITIYPSPIDIYTNSLTGTNQISFWADENMDSVNVNVLNSNSTSYYYEEVWQDDPNWANYSSFEELLATGSTTIPVEVTNCDMLKVHIWGDWDAPDLDLGIFLDGKDSNPVDGITQTGEFVTMCADADANEEAIVLSPEDGTYLIKVYGFTLLNEPAHYDMTIDLLYETEGIFNVSDISTGPLSEYTFSYFNLNWDIPGGSDDGEYFGALFIGTDTNNYMAFEQISLILDRTAPEFSSLEPENNEAIEEAMPTIMASFFVSDETEIDRLSPRIWIDGEEVTSRSTINIPESESPYGFDDGYWQGSISYTPNTPLVNGAHMACVSVNDIAGNTATTFWNFTVDSPNQPGLTHTPEIMTSINYLTPITVIVESDFEIGSVDLFYKNEGQPVFTMVTMFKTGPNTYYGDIPAQNNVGILNYYP